MIGAAILWLLSLIGLLGLWLVGHPSVLDSGEDIPQPHGRFIVRESAWDEHSVGHLFGSFLLALVLGLLGGWGWALSAFLIGVGIELAQAYPADTLKRGVADAWDLLWDAIGVLAAVAICVGL